MRFITRISFLKQISTVYGSNKLETNSLMRQYMTIVASNRRALRVHLNLSPISCLYSSDEKKQFIQFEKKTGALKDAFEHRKVQLKDTEHRIRQKGEEIVRDIRQQRDITGQKIRDRKDHIIKDILETKAKVKERFDEVVEVGLKY